MLSLKNGLCTPANQIAEDLYILCIDYSLSLSLSLVLFLSGLAFEWTCLLRYVTLQHSDREEQYLLEGKPLEELLRSQRILRGVFRTCPELLRTPVARHSRTTFRGLLQNPPPALLINCFRNCSKSPPCSGHGSSLS